jgi:hypothetical protein
MARGTLPIDPISAVAWLTSHADAPPVARAAVLATAGRHEEARSLVESATGVQHYALVLAYVGALLIVWGLGLVDVLLS